MSFFIWLFHRNCPFYEIYGRHDWQWMRQPDIQVSYLCSDNVFNYWTECQVCGKWGSEYQEVDIDKYPNYNERENWWKKQEPDRWDSRVEYPRSKRSRTSADRAATELRKKWQT